MKKATHYGPNLVSIDYDADFKDFYRENYVEKILKTIQIKKFKKKFKKNKISEWTQLSQSRVFIIQSPMTHNVSVSIGIISLFFAFLISWTMKWKVNVFILSFSNSFEISIDILTLQKVVQLTDTNLTDTLPILKKMTYVT